MNVEIENFNDFLNSFIKGYYIFVLNRLSKDTNLNEILLQFTNKNIEVVNKG